MIRLRPMLMRCQLKPLQSVIMRKRYPYYLIGLMDTFFSKVSLLFSLQQIPAEVFAGLQDAPSPTHSDDFLIYNSISES